MIPPLIADMARTHGLPPLKRAVGWMTRLLPIPQPTLFTGAGASARLGQAIGDFHHQRVMVVTDATVARVAELGGRLLVPARALENVGRFAVFADPTGAVFAVMQNAPRG